MARHSNELLIEKFYKNFQKLNAEEMVDCYHPDIHFSDPAFGDLQGKDAGDMWRMLCGNAKDLRILFDRVSAGDRDGSAHWEAHYTFSQTGRKVHNIIEARFVFQDGYIIRHADAFDIWRWSGMAESGSAFIPFSPMRWWAKRWEKTPSNAWGRTIRFRLKSNRGAAGLIFA